MNPRMRSVPGALATALVLMTLLAACASAPPPRPVVVAPAGVTIPIPARVLFEVAPSQRNFNVSSFGPYTWTYREAPLMRAAAIAMMQEMFTDVGVVDTPTENGIVFQISGYTSINPGISRYFATVVADVFVRGESGERQVGQYRATGNAQGLIFTYPPLQAAWANAFSELGKQMLADPELRKRLPTAAPR
jgi:hypothetical protein